MATFGSACALVARLPLNEASQSKFLLSTLSATWPPPRERQDLPQKGPCRCDRGTAQSVESRRYLVRQGRQLGP